MAKQIQYRVGIDVGKRSVGVAAVQIDAPQGASLTDVMSALPIKVLNAQSYIHDGGVDDEKTKATRKANAGILRRNRRRLKAQKRRLEKLDSELSRLGYPVKRAIEITENLSKGTDPLFPWHTRCSAVEKKIENDAECKLAITICVRHIARHRGWKNPYSRFESLEGLSGVPSPFYEQLESKVQERLDKFGGYREGAHRSSADGRRTPAQLMLVAMELIPGLKIRGVGSVEEDDTKSIPMGKLHQSDYYHELKSILQMQSVEEDVSKTILRCVFEQINPRDVGAAAALVGRDDLQPDKPRAARSSLAFQHFRILSTIANLRIADGEGERLLSKAERERAFEFLSSSKAARNGATWNDVAEAIGIERRMLRGVGGQTDDGEPISPKQAPVVTSDRIMSEVAKKSPALKSWWEQASDEEKDMLLLQIDNAGVSPAMIDEHPEAYRNASEILDLLDDDALLTLETAKFEIGRAAYSLDTLCRLNRRMREMGDDLHKARCCEFGIPEDWKPSAAPLGSLLGNASADRVVKFVSRWLRACEKKWGKPASVSIEHTREGFKSAKVVQDIVREQTRRYKRNEDLRESVREKLGEGAPSGSVSRADIRKMQAIERQNSQCLYCGTLIDMVSAQMEHIIPRKKVGASNDPSNLVAVCEKCNQEKGDRFFAEYATPQRLDEVIGRVKGLSRGSEFSQKEFGEFKNSIIERLQMTSEDDPEPSDSFESLAWMACELRRQIEGHFGYRPVVAQRHSEELHEQGQVYVYRGWLTSEARKASGLEKRLPWLGGASGKTRLDRRHHAVDAAVIALMRPKVAQVLLERKRLHGNHDDLIGNRNKSSVVDWKGYEGAPENSAIFKRWKAEQMSSLTDLLIESMNRGRVLVVGDKRLRLSDMEVHSPNPEKAERRMVGDALSAAAIDKAATPALWRALTVHADYDHMHGLPEDRSRYIRLHDRMLGPDVEIPFLAVRDEGCLDDNNARAYQFVRGGLVAVGNGIHHIRVFRVPKKSAKDEWKYYQLRVYGIDLLSAKGDLFSYELPESSITRRFATPKLKQALCSGIAQYVGWAVKGDEIDVDPDAFCGDANPIGRFLSIPDFAKTHRFKLCTYESNTQIKLRPLELSYEGYEKYRQANLDTLTDAQLKAMDTILGDKGWIVGIDALMHACPSFIRRSTLGYVRWKSDNHMPASWSDI